MATLFEIRKEMMDCFDEETGEILDLEKFEQLEMDEADKIENTAFYIKNLESDMEAYKQEKDRFAEKEKKCKNEIERMKQHLAYALDNQPFKGKLLNVKFRKSSALKIDDDCIDLLPAEYKQEETKVKVDKMALKKAVKEGAEFKGVELEEKFNCKID